jgi:hypothetical protein
MNAAIADTDADSRRRLQRERACHLFHNDPTGFCVKHRAQALSVRAPEPRRSAPETGRNDPCACGSGKKHKRCCGGGDGGSNRTGTHSQESAKAAIQAGIAED